MELLTSATHYEIPQGALERMASSPREVSGFFAGMQGTEVSPGVVMYGTPDLLAAWQTFYRLKEEADANKAKREDNVRDEVTVMGNLILPLGAEVVIAQMPPHKAVGKIQGHSTGYKDRPLYRILLRNADGTYPTGQDVRPHENQVHVYARGLVDFGLTILQGVYHVVG